MTLNTAGDAGALTLEHAVGLLDREDDSADTLDQPDEAQADQARPEAADQDAPDQSGDEHTESEADTTAEGEGGEAEGPGDTEEEAESSEPGTVVEAPSWWKAEAKARFADLPPELQVVVLEQEGERERLTSKSRQDLAEARKKAEAETQGFVQLKTVLDQLIPQAQTTFASKWANVDWARWAQEDPQAAFQAKLQYEAEQDQLHKLQLAQRVSQDQQRAKILQDEEEKLKTLAPDLCDPSEGMKRRQAVGQFLIERGATQQELQNVDARILGLAYDAYRYRELLAKMAKPQPKPKLQVKPAVQKVPAKPTAAQPPRPSQARRADEAYSRLSRSGSIDDAVALLNARN